MPSYLNHLQQLLYMSDTKILYEYLYVDIFFFLYLKKNTKFLLTSQDLI